VASKTPNEPEREVTPEQQYLRRRELIKNAALFTASATAFERALVVHQPRPRCACETRWR